MKIAYFSDFFYPQIGGIQDSITALGKELGERGHQIYFFVPYYSKKHYLVSNLPQREPDLGLNVRIIRLPSLPAFESVNRSRIVLPGLFPWLKFQKANFDVIHVQSFWPVGWTGVAAAKLFRIPIIGTNHLAAAHFVQLGKFYFHYLLWFYNRCDYVTAPSAWSFRAEMLPYGFRRPYETISNPIDVETFGLSSEKKEILKKKFGLSKKAIVFGGRLAPEKHIDVMIKAMPKLLKRFPDINLALAGRGAEEGNLKKLSEKLGVQASVKFLGNLDQNNLAALFHASEIFVVTSESETQNMVMLQAMACGLPVVAVRAQALPEYVNDENGFIIPPGDSAVLAEKVEFLFAKPSTLKNLGLKARHYVERFSVPNIAGQWERIYKKVVAGYDR